MGQEFHVVRCYSCHTFQVQQVKKSKKWNCKLCGEKQSLIKEFGRGSGADCRRHVQKLNARRGEMLEEEQQKAWSKWEEDRSEATEDCEDCEDRPEDYGKQNLEGQSRWSKYLDKPDKEWTEEKGENEDEETVFMDRNQIHGIRNVNRKRKRTVGWRKSVNPYHNGEDDMTTDLESWRAPKTTQPTYSSSFTQMERSTVGSPTTNVVSNKPAWTTLPKRLNTTTTSSCPLTPSTTTIAKVSKWAQYLTPRAPSPKDEHEDGDEIYRMSRDEVNNVSHMDPFNSHTLYYRPPRTCNISPVEQGGGFLRESAGIALSKSQCGFKEETNSRGAPALFSLRQENNEQVCEHPQPLKAPPCPSLLQGSLFNTGEELDDIF